MVARIDRTIKIELVPSSRRLASKRKPGRDSDEFDRLVATNPEKALKAIPRIAGPVPSLKAVPFYKKIIANTGSAGEKALEGLVASYTFSMRQDPSLEREALFYLGCLVERKPDDVITRMRRSEIALDVMLRDAFEYGKAEWIKFGYPLDVPVGDINKDAERILLGDVCFVIQNHGFLPPYAKITELCEYIDEDEDTRAAISGIRNATREWLLRNEGSAEEKAEAERLLARATPN